MGECQKMISIDKKQDTQKLTKDILEPCSRVSEPKRAGYGKSPATSEHWPRPVYLPSKQMILI